MPNLIEFIIAPSARSLAPLLRRISRRLPPIAGAPILIERRQGLRDAQGPVHAGAFLRKRRIAFDCTRAEFPRIFAHELFHFAWLRMGNQRRRDFEHLLARELAQRTPGDLGWAAECRKLALSPLDRRRRTRRWREYCCEAFCDTAAWLYSGLAYHREFTLPAPAARRRRLWWERALSHNEIPV